MLVCEQAEPCVWVGNLISGGAGEEGEKGDWLHTIKITDVK